VPHWLPRPEHNNLNQRIEGCFENRTAYGFRSASSATLMQMKIPMEKYAKHALTLGARDAKEIAVDTIVTAPWVRLKCQYGCGGYGQCLTCPPYSPTPEQTACVLKDYHVALLVRSDGHTDATRVAATIERQAFLDGYHKAFAMGSGPCRLCDECNPADRACCHPREARPSMEACGIDVYQTVRNSGFPIEVVKDRSSAQNYYGVVLIE
jgi:predicted metal-binding protein